MSSRISAKAKLGFSGRAVILTFGLLSPNKGIEVMIDAMPLILRSRPDAVYVVLGATHPNLVRQHGEAYREKLMKRVRNLGIEDHVVFLDQFVDRATLLDFIAMCDVYVTPYLNEAQMTSGTLAYSFGLGKAVVSTPDRHARELLADGRGILVPFGVAAVIGDEIAGLLTDDDRRLAMRRRAYASSRSMTWQRTAERYIDSFSHARREHSVTVTTPPGQFVAGGTRARPATSESNISWRCAMIPGCFSTRCIAYPTALTVIASTTTPAHCWSLVPSTQLENSVCRSRSFLASRPSFSTPGTPSRDAFAIS